MYIFIFSKNSYIILIEKKKQSTISKYRIIQYKNLGLNRVKKLYTKI